MTSPRTSRAKPRKKPKQDRSRELVEAILEAAARVFAERGYAQATTNRIAEAAGVSVGSLYQYFPSKDAIAVELLRRYRERLVALVAGRLGDLSERSFASAVRTLIEALLQAEGIEPALHRVLIERVLRTSARAELSGFEERLEALLASALRAAGPQVRVPDVELASFVLVRAVLALVHAAVVDRPGYNVPLLADELTRLVLGYLAPPLTPRSPP